MSGERDDPRPLAQQRVRPKLIVRRLWTGGIAAALVAALIVLVGMLLFGGVLDIPIPDKDGGAGSVIGYLIATVAVGVVATAVLHIMMVLLPRPLQFFNWICGLIIAVAILVPFTMDISSASRLAVATINLVAGICLMAMLSSTGRSSVLVAGPSDLDRDVDPDNPADPQMK